MKQERNDFHPATLSEEQVQKLESLEKEFGYTLVAYEKEEHSKNNK